MDAVEEVKARLDIEQVVGQHVDLKRSGSGLKGLCPFHSEKTPSFFVFPARGTFHCFGCGQGGDVLTFVQTYEKIDFREALQRLAGRAGVELPDERSRRQQTEANARLYQVNEAAGAFFRDQLKTAAGRRALTYLQSRDITARSQHAFALGYAPDSRTALAQALGSRGFAQEELIAAGLIIASDDGSTSRDRFRGRLMFPIRDPRGRVTGFGGRIMGDGEPKYLNSPQTAIFDKSRSLFGLDMAQESIRQAGRAVVVEGYVDAIRAHQSGFSNVVASLGTAITTPQLQIASRMAPTVILALDPDPAGQAAAARTALTALAALPRRQRQLPDSLGRRMVDVGLSVDLRIARIPPDAGDPDELIRRDPTAWRRVLEQSIPAFEFYFETVVTSTDRAGESWRQDLIDRIVPVIQEFSFAVGTQAAWVERLAEVTGVQARLLQSRLTASAPAGPRRPARRGAPATPPPRVMVAGRGDARVETENSLLRILLRKPCPSELVKALSEVRSDRAAATSLLRNAVAHAGDGRKPPLAGLEPEAQELAERLLSEDGEDLPEHRVVPAIKLHIATIRLWMVRARLSDLQLSLSEIGAEDRQTGQKALGLLLAERDDLEKQIAQLQRDVISCA